MLGTHSSVASCMFVAAMVLEILIHSNQHRARAVIGASTLNVPRKELRKAIHCVDHENTVARRSVVIKRRIYSVSHPNALWHIDENNKLIHWRLVVHAGVDGFSRCVVYIKCANNNRAATVLESFMEGLSVFGTPDRVRSDHGGKNVDLRRHVISVHNNQSCVLTGSSTHNERVERMWRDVRRNVTDSFIDTFRALESGGMLDPLNEGGYLLLAFYISTQGE